MKQPTGIGAAQNRRWSPALGSTGLIL